jgi:hypothetical protein
MSSFESDVSFSISARGSSPCRVVASKVRRGESRVKLAAERSPEARLAKQKHPRHPVAMLRSGLSLWLTCVACSAGGDTVSEQHDFSDSAGRSCRATLEKASPGTPSLTQAVSCEGYSRQCSTESRPCFQLNVDDMSEQINNCPACCRGSASSFNSTECSALVCETDADCVYARAQCLGGACVCPDGICE